MINDFACSYFADMNHMMFVLFTNVALIVQLKKLIFCVYILLKSGKKVGFLL